MWRDSDEGGRRGGRCERRRCRPRKASQMRPDGVRDCQNLSGKRSPPRTAKRSPPRALGQELPRDPPVQIKTKMRAPVKGVEVERELETEKSFHGSVSELRKPVKANPAFVQFAWENEPHWMFVLFFSHFLFWLEARAGVQATDALARSPRGARTDSTESVEALAPGPRRRPPPNTGHAELLGRREPLLQQRQVQRRRRDPVGAALRVPTLSRAPRRDPVARRGASGPASSPSRSSSPSSRRSPSASRPTTSSPPSSRRWWPSKPATSRGARKSSRAPSSV